MARHWVLNKCYFCRPKEILGPPLGRPSEDTTISKQQKQLVRQDEIDRIPIEGKFGQGKRRFTLSRIMAKLAITSEAVVMVSFIVMNLEKILAGIVSFLFLLWWWPQDGQKRWLYSQPHRMFGVAETAA